MIVFFQMGEPARDGGPPSVRDGVGCPGEADMIKAVFFDLDGTLLPMDQDQFVRAYFSKLAKKMAPHGYEPKRLIDAIWSGTAAMVENSGGRTNEAVFWDRFSELFGRDVRADEPLFQAFYEKEFQEVRAVCGFEPLSAEIVRLCREKGYRVVLATNPIFPAVATLSRVRWAGLDPADFELITTYENSASSKPNLAYYRALLHKLGLLAEETLMVGNDVSEDMTAQTLGMRVFLLTPCLINRENADISAYPHGDHRALLDFIKNQL